MSCKFWITIRHPFARSKKDPPLVILKKSIVKLSLRRNSWFMNFYEFPHVSFKSKHFTKLYHTFVFQILLPQKNPSACTLGSPYIVPPSSPSCLDSRMGQSSPHTAEQGFSSSKIAETTLLEESPFGNNVFRTSLG